MTTRQFFQTGLSSDPAYVNIRDGSNEFAQQGREFTEWLWTKFAGLEDDHFLEDARAHFHSRFWEMYLGVTLRERGIDVKPGSAAGPDFRCNDKGTSFWVEAVAPGRGDGPDGVPQHELGKVYDVPVRQILLRIANALSQKRIEYQLALQKGLVTSDQPFVLGLNSRVAADGRSGNTLPFFVQALLPFGDLTILLDRQSGRRVDSYYAERRDVAKVSGASVSTMPLLDPEFGFVSAVVHSLVDCVNRPSELGADFQVLHNPHANHPLDHSLFSWCEQFTYNNGQLTRKAV